MKDFKSIVIQSDDQRIGQKIFNFLEWLNQSKRIATGQCGDRCADPFFLPDNKLIKYWNEFDRL